MIPQGAQANQNGKGLEDDLAHLLTSRLEYMHVLHPLDLAGAQRFYCRRWKSPYPTLYGHPMQVDFYLGGPDYPTGLIIEVKYQRQSGSVYEKYVYMVQSLLQTGIPVIILLIGKGIHHGAAAWCQAQQIPGRLKVYTDWEEVRAHVNAKRSLLL